MEAELSDNRTRNVAATAAKVVTTDEYEKLGRDALVALLRSVIEQRDDVLSKYEAMALQVDESTREIDDAQLDARRNAEKAAGSGRLAEEEKRRIEALEQRLDEERRAKATLAEEFARYRTAMAKTPVEDPWGHLWRDVSQILGDWVAFARSKIPPDSSLLPWFDRAVEFVKKTGELAFKMSLAFYQWARPRAIDLWKWLKSEYERRMSQAKE